VEVRDATCFVGNIYTGHMYISLTLNLMILVVIHHEGTEYSEVITFEGSEATMPPVTS
jgi:hypothetical protein